MLFFWQLLCGITAKIFPKEGVSKLKKKKNTTWVKCVILKYGPHIILNNKECISTFVKIKQTIKHTKLKIL